MKHGSKRDNLTPFLQNRQFSTAQLGHKRCYLDWLQGTCLATNQTKAAFFCVHDFSIFSGEVYLLFLSRLSILKCCCELVRFKIMD